MSNREEIGEICPFCGHKMVKMPTWGFAVCLNPNCPAPFYEELFAGTTEYEILAFEKLESLRKKKEAVADE